METEEDFVPGLKGQDRFWVGVMGTTPVGHDSAEQMCVMEGRAPSVRSGGDF